MTDLKYMQRALELAALGRGYTSPNPLVGAVIVKNDTIIGEGFHAKYGDKHAEAAAIENAAASVKGATLYCNLEPCCDKIPSKKTPPCTDIIIKNEIARVVIASRDPNPFVNGEGIKTLRNAGIQVDEGILAEESNLLNERFNKFIKTGLPFVHLKIAQSIDGRIATTQGNSKWITDENARKIVHRYRIENDAVLVGANTALQDNPSLNVRDVEGPHPYRIVLDEKLQLPLDLKLYSDDLVERTFVFTTETHDSEKKEQLEQNGLKIFIVPSDDDGNVCIEEVLRILARQKIASILVEGGSQVFTNFIKAGFIDKVSIFMAPMIIGNGISSIGNLDIFSLDQSIRLEKIKYQIIHNQILVEGYPNLNGRNRSK